MICILLCWVNAKFEQPLQEWKTIEVNKQQFQTWIGKDPLRTAIGDWKHLETADRLLKYVWEQKAVGDWKTDELQWNDGFCYYDNGVIAGVYFGTLAQAKSRLNIQVHEQLFAQAQAEVAAAGKHRKEIASTYERAPAKHDNPYITNEVERQMSIEASIQKVPEEILDLEITMNTGFDLYGTTIQKRAYDLSNSLRGRVGTAFQHIIEYLGEAANSRVSNKAEQFSRSVSSALSMVDSKESPSEYTLLTEFIKGATQALARLEEGRPAPLQKARPARVQYRAKQALPSAEQSIAAIMTDTPSDLQALLFTVPKDGSRIQFHLESYLNYIYHDAKKHGQDEMFKGILARFASILSITNKDAAFEALRVFKQDVKAELAKIKRTQQADEKFDEQDGKLTDILLRLAGAILEAKFQAAPARKR